MDAVTNCHDADPNAARLVHRQVHRLPRDDVTDRAVRVDDSTAWRVAHNLDGWVKVILAVSVALNIAWEQPRAVREYAAQVSPDLAIGNDVGIRCRDTNRLIDAAARRAEAVRVNEHVLGASVVD